MHLFNSKTNFVSEKKHWKYPAEDLIQIWGVVVFILAVPLRDILILYCLLLRKAEFCFCGWEYSFWDGSICHLLFLKKQVFYINTQSSVLTC